MAHKHASDTGEFLDALGLSCAGKLEVLGAGELFWLVDAAAGLKCRHVLSLSWAAIVSAGDCLA